VSTKERIAEAALQLFNEQGMANVSLRTIASAAGMSVGNLTYHYPNKDAVVKDLLDRLIADLNALIAGTQQPAVNLHLLWQALLATYQIQHRYQFILLDLVHLLRQFPAVLAQFQENYQRRQQEFAYLLQALLQRGDLLPEPLPNYYQHYLLPQFYCLSDFWLSEAALLYKGPEEKLVEHYARLSFSLLYPFLSEQGKVDAKEIL
jgi:AcrR family transcriptional regulator